AIRHGCYRNSRLQSIAWSTGTRFSRKQDLWNQAVSMFIAPSEFVRDTFVDAGFDPDKVSVRPHTMPAEHTQTTRSPYGALIVGRLDHEKGAYQIASRWQQQFEKLTVIGVGEELEKIKSLGKTNIECVGWLEPKEVSKLMANARVLLQPSRLLETFGLTLVEAAAASRPSIAFNQGGPASIIRDGETGILVKTNSYDQFISKTQTLMNSPALCDAMGRAARTQYEQLNSTKAGHKSLMSIYQRVAYGRSTQCA
ncbi:MAG: glycosyltransferase family 4 protein, partial [Phycisphaerales bacterium]|nr:glycosyltransferase family 4 protein [Phycisphaerales bacterium]